MKNTAGRLFARWKTRCAPDITRIPDLVRNDKGKSGSEEKPTDFAKTGKY
jgi:hypothetical protein